MLGSQHGYRQAYQLGCQFEYQAVPNRSNPPMFFGAVISLWECRAQPRDQPRDLPPAAFPPRPAGGW
jgi:hypothetical protein